jgi:hypothetical protein
MVDGFTFGSLIETLRRDGSTSATLDAGPTLAGDVGRVKGKLLIKYDPRDSVRATHA